jgi:hypothetical protein
MTIEAKPRGRYGDKLAGVTRRDGAAGRVLILGIEKGLPLGVQQSGRYTLPTHGHADNSHPARRHSRNLA